MDKKLVLVVVAILVLVGGIMLLRNDRENISSQNVQVSGEAENTVTAVSTSTPNSDDSSSASSAVKTFVVTGSNFSFSPSAMTVNKGDTVRITFNNENGLHDLKIDEFNAKTKVLNSDESETIEFVADKSGTFEYYCSVGQHRAMGMKGTLTVK